MKCIKDLPKHDKKFIKEHKKRVVEYVDGLKNVEEASFQNLFSTMSTAALVCIEMYLGLAETQAGKRALFQKFSNMVEQVIDVDFDKEEIMKLVEKKQEEENGKLH